MNTLSLDKLEDSPGLMAVHHYYSGTMLRWVIDELPFDQIQREWVVNNRDLFYFLAMASFVEITSDLYTQSLIEYYDGDIELTNWLRYEWEPQELQHGAALRRYIEVVWPEFDWNGGYEDFRNAYAPLCKPELFGPTRGLELAARCVVETGTATVYTMIHNLTDEPVLRHLTKLIRTDEVGHYGHFFQHFKHYRNEERLSRREILSALWSRVSEVGDEDAWYAFRSIHNITSPDGDAAAEYNQYKLRAKESMRSHYPYAMAMTMMLKPLALNRHLQRLAVPVLSLGAKWQFLNAMRWLFQGTSG